MRSISVCPCVYVLLLEGDENFAEYYYCGSTYCLNQRLSMHIAGLGAHWTRLHQFKSIVEVRLVEEGSALAVENELTLQYMSNHNPAQVRGGRYCRV